VARGSPFHLHISTKYIVIEGGSKQPFPISYLNHFMVAKGGSGQPFPFPHYYKYCNSTMIRGCPFPTPIPINWMKQKVIRGSPFYSLILTNLIIAKGNSRAAPSLFAMLADFSSTKLSRKPLIRKGSRFQRTVSSSPSKL